MRVESDFLGDKSLEDSELYGVQTKRAIENFAIRYSRTNIDFIKSLVLVKLAAARANFRVKKLSKEKLDLIEKGAFELLTGKYDDQFVTPAIQGGAGTSINMNVNEVLCNVALQLGGHKVGEYSVLHPLDDVNMSQSTNDSVPTALKITAIKKINTLVEELMELQMSLQEKEGEFASVKKLGRTQLKDAVETTLGASFGAFAECISRDRWRLYKAEERVRQVNMGGTAIGTGVGTTPEYQFYVVDELQKLTGLGISRAENLIDATQNLDPLVEVSGLLKTLAVNLSKISNDLRLMDSGPQGGLCEIQLPPLQPGSSIMPTKINPVGPEFVKQIYFRVFSNDVLISMAAAEGEFELNAFFPIIADSLLESLEILTTGVKFLAEKVIKGIISNRERCQEYVEKSTIKATKFIDKLGYVKLGKLMKEAIEIGEPIEKYIEKFLEVAEEVE